jgi:hypothetical protein
MYTDLHTRTLTVLVNRIEHEGRTNLDKFNPDFVFKKSKKPDLFKTCISQPLRNSNFIGPESCFGVGFEQTYFKTIP